MECVFHGSDPYTLVKNMDSYFKHMPPDCSLFSEDFSEFPVHKELFYQTKFMCQMIENSILDDYKIAIFCPSLAKEELEKLVKFLYKGKVDCSDQTIAFQVFTNLTQLFGFSSKGFDFNGTVLKSETQDCNGHKVSLIPYK